MCMSVSFSLFRRVGGLWLLVIYREGVGNGLPTMIRMCWHAFARGAIWVANHLSEILRGILRWVSLADGAVSDCVLAPSLLWGLRKCISTNNLSMFACCAWRRLARGGNDNNL